MIFYWKRDIDSGRPLARGYYAYAASLFFFRFGQKAPFAGLDEAGVPQQSQESGGREGGREGGMVWREERKRERKKNHFLHHIVTCALTKGTFSSLRTMLRLKIPFWAKWVYHHSDIHFFFLPFDFYLVIVVPLFTHNDVVGCCVWFMLGVI